jgi:hypothetical protein
VGPSTGETQSEEMFFPWDLFLEVVSALHWCVDVEHRMGGALFYIGDMGLQSRSGARRLMSE